MADDATVQADGDRRGVTGLMGWEGGGFRGLNMAPSMYVSTLGCCSCRSEPRALPSQRQRPQGFTFDPKGRPFC